MAPFAITVNGETIKSEGAVLIVRPSAAAAAASPAPLPPADGAAFLSLRASRSTIYTGEGVGLTLSFFVADNYPYVLNFTALDRQLQTIIKKIRPANVWEENRPINDLRPIAVVINGRKFREIQLYQSVFYPLAARTLTIPAVTLSLTRPRPVIGPPSPQTETVAFASKPLAVTVRGLPPHPLRGQVAVGSFHLNEQLDRQRVKVGESVRYSFTIEGVGNIATLPAPTESPAPTNVDLFPPKERHTIRHGGNQVSGQKTFTYFVVPRQNGRIQLADHFQWIFFDPQSSRYDTLRPRLWVEAGGAKAAAIADASAPASGTGVGDEAAPASPSGMSLYTGIESLDSTQQPVSIPVLIRAIANVLIVLMLLGMIFVFFKK
ncbi:BatD family protein [Spirosoma rigui]|uniref:BatD family protein n=1 Tax=Spirosoma rigui TaxID=564064 RepID=UPI001FE327EB|nr:BatD family protein [Spirosoma rigui]